METLLLQDVAVHPELDTVLKILRMPHPSEEDRTDIAAMLQAAEAVANPKALYGPALLTEKDEDSVTVEGIRLCSPLIRENLDKTSRIVPFVATCGTELEDWSAGFSDPLTAYWADGIKMAYLAEIRGRLSDAVRNAWFQQGDMSVMSPGSLSAWPLTEQRALFKLVGQVTEKIGVRLTASCLMLPSKSVSGFFFSATSHYENCRYCPLLTCPARRAPFEREHTYAL